MFAIALAFFIITSLWYFWGGLYHGLHILQQNSYYSDRYSQWLKKHPVNGAVYLVPIAFIASIALDQYLGIELYLFLSGAVFIVLAFVNRREREIKPLVFTWRVGRLTLTTILMCIAFSCLMHAYFRMSLWWELPFFLSLLHLMSSIMLIISNQINQPIENRIAQGFIRDAKKILAGHPGLKVIGITGSYGKTSTKHILGQLLGPELEVLVTPESYNTTMGVVRTIRENLAATHQVFVVEMGAKKPGDVKEICDVVRPEMGILTSIGEMHLETFGSMDKVIQTKYELAEAVGSDGMMFVNGSNDYIREKPLNQPHILYGMGDAADGGALGEAGGMADSETADSETADSEGFVHPLDVWAEKIVCGPFGSRFTIKFANGSGMGCETRLLGKHNVLNIVAAVSVAVHLGLGESHERGMGLYDLAVKISKLEPVAHRLQLLPPGGKYQIIDDAYNANPEGALEALEVLGSFPGYRVLVTPGLVELGEREEEANYTLGEQAAAHCDYLIFVGQNRSKPLIEGAVESGFDEEQIYVAEDIHDALAKAEELAGRLAPDAGPMTVLLENDLPDNFQ
ncbi:MAG: UDP-N-acetylmuramoyl-tripeptide--D-alanyl-D-alanine ligase [Clostridiales bacterium]|nr:UDP-N-acetylmuramoyl-tripeptide--D-alanyl-D-alanine ligase [Clostridiales bacterium]